MGSSTSTLSTVFLSIQRVPFRGEILIVEYSCGVQVNMAGSADKFGFETAISSSKKGPYFQVRGMLKDMLLGNQKCLNLDTVFSWWQWRGPEPIPNSEVKPPHRR